MSPPVQQRKFSAGGVELTTGQIADAREWAKAQRTFTTGGLACELEGNGVPRQIEIRCGFEQVSLPIASHMIAHWISLGLVKTAGGSRNARAYRWLHAGAE
jgi:hypothetical protein